jgi:hypothetical protein
LDEVLFPLCEDVDVLCTRLPRHQLLREYHRSLGFRHAERSCTADALDPRDTYALLSCEQHADWLAAAVGSGAQPLPWAVTPESALVLRSCGITGFPPVAVAAIVNSKIWSTKLRKKLDPSDAAAFVSSSEELLALGREYLGRVSSIVIKEAYGVSGAGSLRVESERRLNQVVCFLRSQERARRKVALIVEPFFDRAFDFSIYLDLYPSGEVSVVGLQEVLVTGFTWRAITPMSEIHQAAACRDQYYSAIRHTCRALYDEGYFGPVCVDSMVLTNGTIMPVVEVNARFSLGRVNHQLDTILKKVGWSSYFSVVRTTFAVERFGELLARLNDSGGLFHLDGDGGVIPLSSNTLCASAAREGAGQLYFCSPFREPHDVEVAIAKLRSALEQLGAKVF